MCGQETAFLVNEAQPLHLAEENHVSITDVSHGVLEKIPVHSDLSTSFLSSVQVVHFPARSETVKRCQQSAV
jgi:hypothetical protein